MRSSDSGRRSGRSLSICERGRVGCRDDLVGLGGRAAGGVDLMRGLWWCTVWLAGEFWVRFGVWLTQLVFCGQSWCDCWSLWWFYLFVSFAVEAAIGYLHLGFRP